MKKILSLLVISLLIAGMAYGAQQSGIRVSPGTGDIMGQGKEITDPHKTFRLVRFAQRTTGHVASLEKMSKDSIVIWSLSNDGVTVTTTLITCDSRVAGILATNAPYQETSGNTATQDIGKQNWAFLQTYGYAEVRAGTTSGTPISGDAMGTANTDGEAMQFYVGQANGVADAQHLGIAGFWMNGASSNENDCKVFLRLD